VALFSRGVLVAHGLVLAKENASMLTQPAGQPTSQWVRGAGSLGAWQPANKAVKQPGCQGNPTA